MVRSHPAQKTHGAPLLRAYILLGKIRSACLLAFTALLAKKKEMGVLYTVRQERLYINIATFCSHSLLFFFCSCRFYLLKLLIK